MKSDVVRYLRSDDATISVALDWGFDLQCWAELDSGFTDHWWAASSVRNIRARTDSDLPMPI
jgi:hypothetical protein